MTHLRPLLFHSALLGLAAGATEVALRAAPRLGMSLGERFTWIALACLLSVLYTLAAATILWALNLWALNLWALNLWALKRRWTWIRPLGLVAGALVWVHAALWYRYELVVNAFVSDPRVWGGLLGITVVSLGLGWFLHPLLKRLEGRLGWGCLALAVLGTGVALVRGRPVLPEAPEGRRTPVLLVTLDTVRADALSPYGGPVSTPAAELLAESGVVFEQAISTAPLTEPSHLALLTGRTPYNTGVVSNGTVIGDQPGLISHAFAREGYATGAFVAGFPLHGRFGWTQGFHVYDDDFGDVPGLHRLSLVKAWDQVTLPAHTLRERRGDRVVKRALRWLDRVEDRPFFLWLHLFDPHAPYEAPAPYAPDRPPPRDGEPLELPAFWPPPHRSITDTGWLTDAYHGEVRYADALVGQVLDALRERGLLDRTLVVLTADHGESLTEHDYLFDHGDDLYDPSLHVPLVVRYPPVTEPGLRQPCQVGTLDVVPTVLDLANVSTDEPLDGRSLRPLLEGGPCTSSDVVATTVAGRFMARPPVDHALRARDRKYIQHEEGTDELYDLAEDPGELRDLITERPDEAAALEQVLEAELAGRAAVQGPSLDAATTEALEALGYIE